MKKIILSLVVVLSFFQAFSQKVYFIYLQHETDQPFYVRMKDKMFHSSASGYLVLSNLRDTIQTFQIGFPGQTEPEKKFSVVISSRDHGYLIKNFGEKGVGLFNLQTMAIQMPLVEEVKAELADAGKKSEPTKFTQLLAKAVDDSLLLKPLPSPVVKVAEVKKEEPVVAIEKTETVVNEKPADSMATEPAPGKKEEIKAEAPVKTEEPKAEKKSEENEIVQEIKTDVKKPESEEQYKKSIVIKRSESSTTEGFGLVFIDRLDNAAADTIRILIPNPKPIVKETAPEKKEEIKFLDLPADTSKGQEIIPQTEIKDTVQSIPHPPTIKETKALKPVVKNNCRDLASEKDYNELKNKMTAAADDEGRINEAKKYFKLICFSTTQIRNLSVLFATDEGKYRFFDAAYSYVTDADQFPSLESELKEEYYINRFKAMLK